MLSNFARDDSSDGGEMIFELLPCSSFRESRNIDLEFWSISKSGLKVNFASFSSLDFSSFESFESSLCVGSAVELNNGSSERETIGSSQNLNEFDCSDWSEDFLDCFGIRGEGQVNDED